MPTLLSLAIAATIALPSPQTQMSQKPETCPMGHAVEAAQPAADAGRSALTAEQIQQLLAGEGMGQAKAAETSGYPGPKHVLDMAEALKLTPDQRASVSASFERMNTDARRLGAEIVQAERDLYAAFQSHTIKAEQIEQATLKIGHLQANLRARHLLAHLETNSVLTPEQIAEYARLRAHVVH